MFKENVQFATRIKEMNNHGKILEDIANKIAAAPESHRSEPVPEPQGARRPRVDHEGIISRWEEDQDVDKLKRD